VLHVTDREGGRQYSTCVFQLTVREGFCRGVLSGPEGRRELRRKRDESLDNMFVLALLALHARRGFGGIWRNRATESMLWCVMDSFKGREGSGFGCFGFVGPRPLVVL
jgi:hypothetical protein